MPVLNWSLLRQDIVIYCQEMGAAIMSPQETQALQDFLNQLTQVRGVVKDPQAAAMIASAVAQQPDAAYLLVQRALLMEQALTTSKAQIASLQNQLQAAQSAAAPARGFLDGNSWGSTPTAASRPAPVSPAAYAPPAPAYTGAPMPMQAPQYQAAPPASSGFFGGGLGSTLGAVAATAAGVAGGAFLFQGIEHLMNSGSSGSGSSLMHSGSSNMPTEVVENTTINNYYSSDDGSSRNRDDARSNDFVSNDILDDNRTDYSSNDSGSDYASSSDSSFDDSII